MFQLGKRENLETKNATNETRLVKILEYWGRNETHSNLFTWQTIVNVLASDAIKKYKLAREIRKKRTMLDSQSFLYVYIVLLL